MPEAPVSRLGPTQAQADWVARVLGISPATPESEEPEADAFEPPPPDLPPEFLVARQRPAPKGMAAWKAARARAIATLRELQDAFRDMAHPDSEKGIILLRALQANLTEHPDTPAQVAELERYISTDDIVTEAEVPNGFGIVVDLRAPLLAALASLREEQSAGAGGKS
jgi:hypothetical protein